MAGVDVIGRRVSDFNCDYFNTTEHSKTRAKAETSTGRVGDSSTPPKRHNSTSSGRNNGVGTAAAASVVGVGGGGGGGTDAANGPSVRGASRQRQPTNDSLKKHNSKTRSRDHSSAKENRDKSSVLPPISNVHPSNAQHSKPGMTSSPRIQGALHGVTMTVPHTPTRLAIRNSTPDFNGARSHLPEHVYNGQSKTPPFSPHRVVNGAHATYDVTASVGDAGTKPPGSPDSFKLPETTRLSPVYPHDKPKVKFEKKVLKTLVETDPLLALTSPRGYKIQPSDSIQQLQSRDCKTKPRRSIEKTLPKLASSEEPFSIRRKIEQFRKWHEDHYVDKLQPSMGGGHPAQNPENMDTTEAAKTTPEVIDFAKILDKNIFQNRFSDPQSDPAVLGDNVKDENGNVVRLKKDLNPRIGVEAKVKARRRPPSGTTWKTWRDVNTSDAYNDVDKYIKDNDLMDDEREEWIRAWIRNVKKATDEDKVDISMSGDSDGT